MADTSRIVAVAEVYESDAARLLRWQNEGKQIKVTVKQERVLPEVISGQIINIGHIIARNQMVSLNPTDEANSRVVEVRILLGPNQHAAEFLNLQVQAMFEAP
jgi:HlyD family secretion protein